MNQRKLRIFCAAMLVFAVFLRLACPEKPDGLFVHPVRTAAAAPEEPSEPKITVYPVHLIRAEPEVLPLPEPEPEPEAPEKLVFSPEEAEAIRIGGSCTYPVDRQALLQRPSGMDLSGPGPKVLIVHTHSSEAYTQEAGFFYEETDPLRTSDAECSVIRIGSRIAELLEAAGIETIHDTALNDYPQYDGAYDRMKTTIDAYMAQYPSIQMVLDIHRDAAEDTSGFPVALSRKIGEESCAQLMLVVGTDEGGLSHPDWEENLANALKLQALLNRSAPGLCRNLDLRRERFNQHESPGSVLVEFGASGNTMSEALRSAEIFGEALCELLTKLP